MRSDNFKAALRQDLQDSVKQLEKSKQELVHAMGANGGTGPGGQCSEQVLAATKVSCTVFLLTLCASKALEQDLIAHKKISETIKSHTKPKAAAKAKNKGKAKPAPSPAS